MSLPATQPVIKRPGFQAIGSGIDPAADELQGLLTSQLSPKFQNLAAAGRVFYATHTIATAVAPLQVVPTTTAAFVVNNVSTRNNMCVFLKAGLILASGTAGAGLSLYGQIGSTALATQLTADGSGVTRGCGRGGADASDTFADLSKTVAGGWALLGAQESTADAVPGSGFVVPLDGFFIARPTFALGLHAVAGAGTTAKFSFYALWVEVPITLA